MSRTALAGVLVCLGIVAGAPAISLGGEPAAPQAPPARPAPVPRPSLAEAQQMLAASQAAASKTGVPLTCAVVDVRGDLVALARMDGVAFLTAGVAQGKAVASALFGAPSGGLPPILTSLAPSLGNIVRIDMLPLQGALPVSRNGQILGAIGCSGGTGQQDEDAARAGAQTFR